MDSLLAERADRLIEGLLAGEIRGAHAPALTFYTHHGEVFAAACAAAAALSAGLGAARGLRRRQRVQAAAKAAPAVAEPVL